MSFRSAARRARRLEEVPDDVQTYLLMHGRRDMGSLLTALERLKDTAFADKRKITVPLAREVLTAGHLSSRYPEQGKD